MNKKSSVRLNRPLTRRGSWISGISWFVAICLAAAAIYLGWIRWKGSDSPIKAETSEKVKTSTITPIPQSQRQINALPVFSQVVMSESISRRASLYTDIPNRPRQDVVEYTVDLGDSVFAIAQTYNIKPETLLWSNYDLLKDNPHSLSVGMVL